MANKKSGSPEPARKLLVHGGSGPFCIALTGPFWGVDHLMDASSIEEANAPLISPFRAAAAEKQCPKRWYRLHMGVKEAL